MLKATNGGGGRGIRRCANAKELPGNYDRVISETSKAFGSAEVFMEKCIDNPRHIEVQRALVAQGYGYSLANVRPVNQHSLDGSRLRYVPLSGYNPGLTLGIATLANIRKTIVVDIFSQFCRAQINSENIPGMARL